MTCCGNFELAVFCRWRCVGGRKEEIKENTLALYETLTTFVKFVIKIVGTAILTIFNFT